MSSTNKQVKQKPKKSTKPMKITRPLRRAPARNYGIGQDNAYFDNLLQGKFKGHEPIARLMCDPSHLENQAQAPLLPDDSSMGKALSRIVAWDFNLGVAGGASLAISTIPFFEVPVAYRWDDGAPMVGVPNPLAKDGVPNVSDWLYKNNIYAWRTVAKSMTVTNVTPVQSIGGTINAARFMAMCDFEARKEDGYTLAGASATASTAINIKILQGMPGSSSEHMHAPGAIRFTGEEGTYMVNKVYDPTWRYRTDSSTKAAVHGVAPLSTDTNTAIAFTDRSAAEGVGMTYLEYAAATSGYTTGSKCTASYWDGTDITSACITAPTGVAQTYNIKIVMVVEMIPKLNSGFGYELQVRTPEDEFFRLIRKFANEQGGIYPSSYNDWGTLWKGVKNFLGKALNFYKSNSSILKPALNLIPGAGTALNLIDRFTN